jgi:hypothetical protein
MVLHRMRAGHIGCQFGRGGPPASASLVVGRICRMSIESDIIERGNRTASKKQIPISDTREK